MMDMTWEQSTLADGPASPSMDMPTLLDQAVPALTGDGQLMLATAGGTHNSRAVFVETHALSPSVDNVDKHTLNTPTLPAFTQPFEHVVDDHAIEDIMSEYFTSTPVEDYCASSQSSTDSRSALLSAGEQESVAWLETSMHVEPPLPAEVAIQCIEQEIRAEARELESASPAVSDEHSSRCASVDSLDAFIQDYARCKRASTDNDLTVLLPPKRKYTKRANRPLSLQEKRDRKKQQNVEAARRYRVKKNAEKYGAAKMLHDLHKRNTALRATIKTTEDEIDIMKKLLHDVRSQID